MVCLLCSYIVPLNILWENYVQDINNEGMYMVCELICGQICHCTLHFNIYIEFLSFLSDLVALLNILLYFVQKDNIRNQRENVILALANAQARLGLSSEREPVSNSVTLQYLPIFFLLNSGYCLLYRMQDIYTFIVKLF